MRLFLCCTTYLATALAFISLERPSLRADDGHEIPHEAAKLNQRGLDYLHKKQYDQAVAVFREARVCLLTTPERTENSRLRGNPSRAPA